jgi:hypothetical protein
MAPSWQVDGLQGGLVPPGGLQPRVHHLDSTPDSKFENVSLLSGAEATNSRYLLNRCKQKLSKAVQRAGPASSEASAAAIVAHSPRHMRAAISPMHGMLLLHTVWTGPQGSTQQCMPMGSPWHMQSLSRILHQMTW